MVPDLKAIYQAENAEGAGDRLTAFNEAWGKR